MGTFYSENITTFNDNLPSYFSYKRVQCFNPKQSLDLSSHPSIIPSSFKNAILDSKCTSWWLYFSLKVLKSGSTYHNLTRIMALFDQKVGMGVYNGYII